MYSCTRLCFMIESSDKKEIMESNGITGEITVICQMVMNEIISMIRLS